MSLNFYKRTYKIYSLKKLKDIVYKRYQDSKLSPGSRLSKVHTSILFKLPRRSASVRSFAGLFICLLVYRFICLSVYSLFVFVFWFIYFLNLLHGWKFQIFGLHLRLLCNYLLFYYENDKLYSGEDSLTSPILCS